MTILKQIKESIYGPELYQSLRSERTGLSVKFFIKLSLILAIVQAILLSFSVIPDLRTLVSTEGVSSLVSFYPEELNLKIKDGQFSTNVNEPYFIPIPADSKSEAAESNKRQIDNFLVINTKIETFSSNVLDEYKTAALITKDSLITDDKGSLKVTSLAAYKDLSYDLNRKSIENFALKILPVFKTLIYFIPFLIAIGLFMARLFLLIPLFILALLVWLLLVIKKSSGGYMYAYRVAIHSVVLCLILNIVSSAIFGYDLNGLIFLIITLIVAGVNVKKETTIAEPAVSNPVQ